MIHLVYCDDKEKVLEKILSGEKTMIVRGAAGRKIPHSRVFEGETLYFIKNFVFSENFLQIFSSMISHHIFQKPADIVIELHATS